MENEQPDEWRTSTYDSKIPSDEAVRLRPAGDGKTIEVTGGTGEERHTLHFTRGEMLAFLQGAKAGEFDDLAEEPETTETDPTDQP